MPETTVHPLARCGECGKPYRVPHADRTYPCKACGGEIRVVEEPTQEAKQQRQEASDSLKRAYKGIAGITWLYRLGALAYAIATLFAIVSLARADIPRGGGVVVVVLMSVLSALMLMGAIHVVFQPFAWTVAIACVATFVTVVHLIGPNPFGVAFIGSAAWAVVSWLVLVPTLRYHRLIAEHRDQYILHHASVNTRRSLKGRTGEERHERLLDVMHRAAKRAWAVSAVASVLFLLASAWGTRSVLSNLRPIPFEPALESFETTWNEQDFAAVTALLDSRVHAQESARLLGLAEGHGLPSDLPALRERQVRREEEQSWVDYKVGTMDVSAHWVLNDRRWNLVRIEIPLPPIEPVFEEFLDAWRRSDPEALVAFYSADNRESMLESIQDSIRERGWDTFPNIQDTDVSAVVEEEVVATLKLDRGKATTRWHMRPDGTWGLRSLKLPKR